MVLNLDQKSNPHFRPKSAGISPHALVSHFIILVLNVLFL